ATTIMAGDFNMEPDSQEYTAIVGPDSPYGGRVSNPELFVDAFVAAGHAEGDGVTADIDGRPVRLDYFFVSPALVPNIVRCEIDNDAVGSHHQPVWLELAAPAASRGRRVRGERRVRRRARVWPGRARAVRGSGPDPAAAAIAPRVKNR